MERAGSCYTNQTVLFTVGPHPLKHCLTDEWGFPFNLKTIKHPVYMSTSSDDVTCQQPTLTELFSVMHTSHTIIVTRYHGNTGMHTIHYYSCCVNQLWTCSTLLSSTRPTRPSAIYDVTVINGRRTGGPGSRD